MTACAPTPAPNMLPAHRGGPPPWTARVGHWLVESRAHRVICLILGIWLLNAFDLALTIMSHQQGILQEGNPLARHMLSYGLSSMILYKVGLVLIGSYPLLRFRRARITELGAFVIVAAYVFLAVHWSTCYELFASTANLPEDFATIETGLTSPQ